MNKSTKDTSDEAFKQAVENAGYQSAEERRLYTDAMQVLDRLRVEAHYGALGRITGEVQ